MYRATKGPVYGATKGTRPDRIRTLLVRGPIRRTGSVRSARQHHPAIGLVRSPREHHPAAETASYSLDACPLVAPDGLGIGRDRSGLLGPFLTDSRTSPKMGPRRRPGEGSTIDPSARPNGHASGAGEAGEPETRAARPEWIRSGRLG